MIKLFMLRHAESTGNATGEYSSLEADSLSPKGKVQALKLADSLSHSWRFDSVIASPRERTLQTICPYLAATGQRGEIWPELAEACWHDEREPVGGNWKSKPALLEGCFADHFYFRDDNCIQPNHPETFGAGLRRVHDALELIEQKASHGDLSILMVSHGHFIREMLNLMLGAREPVNFHHDNAGLTLMTYSNGWSMNYCNRLTVTNAANGI